MYDVIRYFLMFYFFALEYIIYSLKEIHIRFEIHSQYSVSMAMPKPYLSTLKGGNDPSIRLVTKFL